MILLSLSLTFQLSEKKCSVFKNKYECVNLTIFVSQTTFFPLRSNVTEKKKNSVKAVFCVHVFKNRTQHKS